MVQIEPQMTYKEWEVVVPKSITNDVLWKVSVYRYSLFLGDIAWQDVTKLMQDRRTISLADQLYRAVGSIGANIAEGYSRGTGKDRARFYEYSLGSARESRDWYFKARHLLGDEMIEHRFAILTEIIKLLLTMVPQQRARKLSEEPATYQTESIIENII
jgi:four helix bundle protein